MTDISGLIGSLSERALLPLLDRLVPSWQDLYLVGGSVRDWLLGRPLHDFDFATAGDPTDLARSFARAVGGHWFSLDDSFCQSRVVYRLGGEMLQCDFAPLRAATLTRDLAARDFTLNAMAIDLCHPERGLLDPLGGLEALRSRKIRACSAEVLQHDPLRCLRGIRFAAQLQMEIDAQTWSWIVQAAPLQRDVAGERLQLELVQILSLPDRGLSWRQLTESGFWQLCGLEQLSPITGSNMLAAADERLLQLDESLGALLEPLLQLPLGNGCSRLALLRLAIGLRSTVDGRGLVRLSERLRWGRRLSRLIEQLCCQDDSFATTAGRPAATKRGRLHHFLSLSSDPLSSALLAWLLGQPQALTPEQIVDLAADLAQYAPTGQLPPLVEGRWLVEELGIEPGPDVGRLLACLTEAEAAGEVNDREEACAFLRRLTNKPLTSG